jgi:cell division protein FtsX
MKFLFQTLAIIIVCFILQTFLPWWSLSIGALAIGALFANKGWVSFFAGLLGVGLLWFGMAFYIDAATQSILTSKVAQLFPTKTVPLLMLVTSLVGGLVGGFASLTGSLLTYKKRKW